MSTTFDLAGYWDARYAAGRDSGEGSRGQNAVAKAAHVNAVIAREGIRSVTDWGCGDGQVLAHITPDIDYLGVDISPTILARLAAEHPGRRFALAPPVGKAVPAPWTAELCLSMDVLFHLVDDTQFDEYLGRLFGTATRLVLIYSTDHDGGRTARHVRWRHWTPTVAARFPDWDLVQQSLRIAAPGFYLYRRRP